MAVFKVNVRTGVVEARIKTGWLVGADRDGIATVGGASPACVAVGRRAVYAANATNDSVSVIDPETGAIVAEITLTVPGMERLRGVLPFGLALAPDESRLYAACAGLNAVAVIDTTARKQLGFIPAGWFCNGVAVSRDGRRLYVTSAKGMGSGPNGGAGFKDPPRGAHPGYIMQGLFQALPVPDAPGLAAMTKRVIEGTVREVPIADGGGANPLPPAPGIRKSPIRHIVFIVKENRTFDQVFGARKGVDGDPSLAELGLKRDIPGHDGLPALAGVDVSPNHHALADRFAISDNFHCDSDQSNTGHRWVAGVYPNEWVEVNARSDMDERIFSDAPGRRYVAGSSAAVFPEDYNEAGALWEHLARHNVPFWNFGFGTELPATLEERFCLETGIRMAVSFPLPKPLFDRTSRTYPTYNMAIPDQYRADMFEEEFAARWANGKEEFPRLITLVLTQDHMTDPHPADGYPYEESYMADNDLALGRLVRTLSRSRWWKEMLVIVVEDDPQGGRDHLEAHRSVLMFISPWAKRGYVSHTLVDFGSVMKTIFNLLDLPPLNQFDAAASLPSDAFASQPDYEPYSVLVPDRRLFDPDLAFKPFDRRFNWKGIGQSPVMDDPEDMRKKFEK
jgi:YVTN family beta-propeller protein